MNTAKMHYSCMKVGPTMECGDPPPPHLDIVKGREGKPNYKPMLISSCNHRNHSHLEIHHGLFTKAKTQPIPNNSAISLN